MQAATASWHSLEIDMALYSLSKLTILCALFQAAAGVRRYSPPLVRTLARVHYRRC